MRASLPAGAPSAESPVVLLPSLRRARRWSLRSRRARLRSQRLVACRLRRRKHVTRWLLDARLQRRSLTRGVLLLRDLLARPDHPDLERLLRTHRMDILSIGRESVR